MARMKSKSAITGVGVAVVGGLAILGASFGLKSVGDNRTDDVSRGAAATDVDFFSSEYCMGSLWTRVRFENQLPVDVKISSVTDVDPFDWCNSADGYTAFLPSDSANESWGLTGLAVASKAAVNREIDPRVTSMGSPFTLTFTTPTNDAIGPVQFDVTSPELHRGLLVARGDSLPMSGNYTKEKAVGAMIVNGQPRPIVLSISHNGWDNVVDLRLG